MQGGILEGLNAEQRRAAMWTRGPVCILAGAGSGKTTTITRRIAYQVATEAFRAHEILAVTFTDKAAGEMRDRLGRLGVGGVRASTFHSAALAQLRALSGAPPPQILPSKAAALRQIGNALPKPYRFRPAADLATEVEWARNRRIAAGYYLDRLDGHEPPIPPDLMVSVLRRYEKFKRDRGLADFEDVLELAVQMYEQDAGAVERFRGKYAAFTVDEYQDVNLLQETLLRLWIGGRRDVCVVGDDYQSIYGFTGATPEYLLDMPRRFTDAHVVRLEHNYRSTPEILEVANRLVPELGGAPKVLRPTRPPASAPALRSFPGAAQEMAFLVAELQRLHGRGVSYEDMAVLYRLNFRSEDFEEALAEAGIPFQVRDGAFLSRQTARYMLAQLRRAAPAVDLAAHVRALAERAGYLEEMPDGLGEQEMTRQSDLGRFIRLAEEFDDGERTPDRFVADVEARFATEGGGRGVNLLTFHRAKGLEFEAVLLAGAHDRAFPGFNSRSDAEIDEDRRVLYVGMTRARRILEITYPELVTTAAGAVHQRAASPFLAHLTPA